jgi:hypothetical protein
MVQEKEKNEETKAIELLQNKEQEKVKKFQEAFKALCKDHGFILNPVLTVREGKIEGSLEIVKSNDNF